MFIRPLDTSESISSRLLGNLFVGVLATAALLIVAAGLFLAAFEAQGKPTTPYRASLVGHAVQEQQAVHSVVGAYPDVTRDALVMPMVCPRDDALDPFWLCA